jgi:hypothetical protein
MEKQYVIIDFLRQEKELKIGVDHSRISIKEAEGEDKIIKEYHVLGLVFEPVLNYFKKAHNSDQKVNVLQNNYELLFFDLESKKIDWEHDVPVLVNSSSLINETYSRKGKIETTGLRILPLEPGNFQELDEVQEMNLKKLVKSETIEGTLEHQVKQDYTAFLDFIVETKRDFNRWPINEIPFIYIPDKEEMNYFISSLKY